MSVANLEEVYDRKAPSLHPVGHLDHSASVDILGVAVDTRYRQSGSMENLEAVVTFFREALGLFPPGDPVRSWFLNELANALHTRYK